VLTGGDRRPRDHGPPRARAHRIDGPGAISPGRAWPSAQASTVADGRPEGPASLHDIGHVGWLCLVETHPAWQASEARPASTAGWLVGHRGLRRGRPTSTLLQLSDKHGWGRVHGGERRAPAGACGLRRRNAEGAPYSQAGMSLSTADWADLNSRSPDPETSALSGSASSS
jgi:hypothetical protein